MNFQAALLLLIAFVGGSSSVALSHERINNGVVTQPGEFPYVVSIAVDGNHTCSGFIYNTEWVVTTASCVQNIRLLQTNVVVGQFNLLQDDPFEMKYTVFSIIPFAGYNEVTKLHDLALIQLAKPIVFNAGVTCIPYEEQEANTATIMGWGSITQGGLPTIRLRKGVVNNLVANCATDYPGNNFDRNYMICAGEVTDTQSPCEFDEGAPLVQIGFNGINEIVGIFSKSVGCQTGKPSIYTRLAPYYAWFEQYAKKQPVGVCGVI